MRAIRPIRKAIIAPLGNADRLFPASVALSPLLFPLVDRNGLSKPVLQIIAEDAIESGIELIAVQASEAVELQFRSIFRQRDSKGTEDWHTLQSEKLSALADRLHFIPPTIEAAKAFIGEDDFAFVPADVLYVSGTKNRSLEQLIDVAERQDADCLLAVQTVIKRQALEAVVVSAAISNSAPTVYQVSEISRQPTLDQCTELFTPGLPPEQFLAATGLAILTPAVFDVLPIDASINALASAGRVYAAPLSVMPYNLQNPYGFLEGQLALGLAGIHRIEICEMIARTLAEQAKS